MLLQGVKTAAAVALLLALGRTDARPMDVDQWPSTEVRLLLRSAASADHRREECLV